MSTTTITQAVYYMVKNVSASDKSQAIQEVASGTLPIGPDTYDILVYNGEFGFDGTESYAQILTFEEKSIAVLCPAFIDWSAGLNNPATHMATHKLIRPFEENDTKFCVDLNADMKAHLSYVIGTTPAQNHAMYNGTLLPLAIDLGVGDVVAAADFLSGLTGAILQGATGHGTIAQWDQLLTHVGMMAGPFLEKFPR